MMNLNIFIFVIFNCLCVCVGQYVQFGQCDPNIQVVEEFDIEAFSGIWYEIQRTSNPQQNGDCAYFEISTSADNTTNVTTVEVYHNGVDNNFQEDAYGNIIYNDTARMTLNISMFDETKDFWVILSDPQYNSYSVVYSCENISPTQRSIHLWILGRTRQYLTEMVPIFIQTRLEELFDINLPSLQYIDQNETACYVLPVIPPGESVVLQGQCDESIPVQQNFSVADFTGIWHQISSYYTENSDGTCVRAEYTIGDDAVNVLNSQVLNQTLFTITGTASVASTDNSARLSVILNVTPNVSVEQDLWIISTDYTNYAISYSCENLENNQKRINSWILSRTRVLSPAVQDQVNEVVDSILELNDRYYISTDQTSEGCFFYPEPSNEAVIFRGQCDMNIPAKAEFDAVAYMGLWHNIELYPTPFQFGACSNAYYELVGSEVSVYNTQVVNQTLETISGTAVLVSDDGTAKLKVTFPIVGTDLFTDTDYWVLDTDYVTYAFVYSCRNLDDDTMQVSSWKLSRTKQLGAAQNTLINNIMATIPVLDQRYFYEEGQTAEDCFFYPTPQPGEPVVFPGECQTDIAMQNFVLSQFIGIWYEIEAYPKIEQTGHCTNHNYSFVSNTQLNFVTSNVNDQFLSESDGILTSTDASGRLTITITVDGLSIPIPFWIINTDYNDYALAYSCVNRPNDFRAVWSWKLSRTKELSPAAQTAINTASQNIDVLQQRYYEEIDQSDRACFYLPEIEDGEPIILPGQCNTNISAISNFNPTQFSGRWRIIANYPADDQIGTCNDVEFNLIDTVTYYTVTTQVVNETLITAFGNTTITSNDGSGRLEIAYPNGIQPSELLILDTDYSSYALLYGCENVDTTQRRVWSWKLSRNTGLSDTANTNINQIISDIEVLNNRYYQQVPHTEAGCFYFPELIGNENVKFRGQCNENIQVVQNFNVEMYLGLWHDISSYPMFSQFGTCPNAQYMPGDDAVNVYNTQVVSQRLDTIEGIAELASTDGSAKLNVTFNVQGFYVSSNYWVLATDYSTFAYVYSCENIDDEYMYVFSWKLSRTKSLTPTAIAEIDRVKSTLNILDDRYYLDRNQSEEGCFYYPEPEENSPVMFPGQCDNNIAAISGFNPAQFAGLWHETAYYAYNTNSETGQCVNHQFNVVSPSVINLESSNVLNQSLSSTNNVLNLATIDGTGKFTIQLTINGQIETVPFWILATDYNDYALAYGCVNRGSDYRQIFSWKLSRTKTPTATGNAAIEQAMVPVNVIDNRYYTTIEQTDDACFYLPVLSLTEPVIFPGQCDQNITVIQNFDAARYLGTWRLIETYYADFQNGSCSEARYSEATDGSVVVYNTQVVDRQLDSITGSAVLPGTEGKLLVTFPTSDVASEYWILDTDYDTYALVYSCLNINENERRVWSWKMSRTNSLSNAANAAINQIVNSINVLNDQYYQNVDRTEQGCFYFPEPDNTTPVIFRGQCDESINVIPNFAADRYLGLWYDVESYPMPFQFGSCPNAFYSLGDNVVNVYNTQVINETLDTIHGVAEIVGNAKLNVTFNVQGFDVTSDYWVLDTDYENYALVYSCRNVDEYYKSVSSWKLSRHKLLTPASVTAINTVMNTLDILDQRYYVDRDQSTEGCFYYPEPEPGTPVVFPGQCDTNIAVVSNFNPLQFTTNLWHEIESYPFTQTGDCVNHQFGFISASSFTLQSSTVVNQTLLTTNSQVTSTDGTARLSVQVTIDGQAETIPFWILATDYSDYALAYGCVNLNATFRQIYSWKLSRTRVPTAAGTAAINNAMSGIEVLDNRYYDAVSQTDEACFYLPELSPTDPVTFPGQCDPNIPVVANFDAARYLGRWRLIETYYADFQTGNCNEATYTLAADGTVDVYNTEVVNEQLESITGSAVTTDGSGKLVVTFPTTNAQTEYWILDTDYDNYTLVYSCENIAANRRRVWSWKMSRTNSLSDAANIAIQTVVDSINVLDDRYYQTVDRSDESCFYYPTPDANTPVVFRGQCDMNIPAFPNFDAVRYLGFWNDLQSYPAPFQTGTCNNAEYSLNDDGSVHVENTQVVDQRLETWIGRAVIDTDDGSAKLSVTFNVNGVDVTTKYWVLTTDYDNYALVYSCENIDDERRSVFSWKLSRSTSLSTDANTAINNVMNTVPVIDQRYFVERSQTEESCFYYPENNGGDVILSGQCFDDSEVPVVEDFNANLFAGTWHEISRFPSGVQAGDCISTQYTTSGSNAFTVTQTSINNERQVITNTQATLVNETRGVIGVNIDGVPFEDVYILGTDYSQYALAYSCRNLDNETKQIYSWKLSRSPTGFSAAANAAIDELVTDNIDLWEGYYRVTGQDNDACFYYPVFDQLPSSIVLPGPCPDNIRGVANFDAAAYLGRWFETARYPAVEQIGQCSRAEYSLTTVGGTDRVFVSNTQVVNETLLTQLGFADVASTDGTGQLNVEFVVDGVTVTANYYILATDYTSYSLVYSCANLNTGESRVSSWKLSRTPTLSPEAISVMDNTITNTRGLLEEYYLSTSQSDDSCFYIPPVSDVQAPVFRGQCDESITGVAGFDVARYLGWWHEIESYPVDGTSRDCRSSEYSQDGTTYRVVDGEVSDNEGFYLTGTVTVTNDGRLRRSMLGRPDQDIWVLATDYETYALLYSCENIDSETRRVWSAKHSKSRSLTEAAQNAMAPLIESNRVLYPQFYLSVDQSDSVCFHYPTITSGDIVIPGQCDLTIPVQQNFNVEDFAGTWYHTEMYDDVGTSSCVGSRYTVNEENGEIAVLNFNVNSEDELETVEGTAVVQSADGSARSITLSFPASESGDATVTTTVSILATDYANYAVVYNCANVGSYRRRVRAWKLSSERAMSPAATSAIALLIQQRQELNQMYFKPITQNEECEEPSSAFFFRSSIILIVMCATLQLVL